MLRKERVELEKVASLTTARLVEREITDAAVAALIQAPSHFALPSRALSLVGVLPAAAADVAMPSDAAARVLYAPAKVANTQLASLAVLPLLAYKASAIAQGVKLQWYLDGAIALATIALVVYASK